MSKLYVFGDSYSVSWNDRLKEEPTTMMRIYAEYYQNKFNKVPQHFEKIIQNKFNLKEIVNCSAGGSDNYFILELIGRVIPSINSDDYVIIGWSDISRTRYINNKSKLWNTVTPNSPWLEDYTPQSFQEQVVLRDSKLPMIEIGSWQNILLKGLPQNTIFWSPFRYNDNEHTYIPFKTPHDNNPKNINEETNGELEEYHYGNDGMEIIGEWMIDLFNNNPYRKTTWI